MRLNKYLGFVLGGSMSLAGMTFAGCGQQAPVTVYDEDHHDNHKWDASEAAAYQRWEAERGKPHQDDFTKRPPEEQKDYWNWRHSHP